MSVSSAGPSVAVAESCTAGRLAVLIEELPDSGDWFKGGLVPYHGEMKFRLLGVPVGPVITRAAAIQMARGVRTLMSADIGVATTGVAGPERQENLAVGTVYVGVVDGSAERSVLLMLEGSPSEIKQATSAHALQQVLHCRKFLTSLGEEPAAAMHTLAVPEGEFVINSSSPLTDVSIIGSTLAFRVDDDQQDRIAVEMLGLDEEGESPQVLFGETGAESLNPGARDSQGRVWLDVATRTPLEVTWVPHRPPVN